MREPAGTLRLVTPQATAEVDNVTETFQITRDQAMAYEDLFVPALFAQWAPQLVDIAHIAPGQRVLDVACGTGVVARVVAGRVADPSLVVGVDLNPAMLDVAASIRPDIGWRQADAARLPFEDAMFDAVLCQSALFFFPDVQAAVSEMARVTKPGGAVAIQTYASLDSQPAYGPFVDVVVRHAGSEARSLLDTYFSAGNLDALCATLESAGLAVQETRSTMGTARYGSVGQLIEIEVKGTPLAGRLSEETVEEILNECRDVLTDYSAPSGTLGMPIRALLVAGRRL